MTNRNRNIAILGIVVALLAASAVVIVTKPTKLGLDLKGGIELVYQGRPTPQVPKVTPAAVDDAINTIRKRTDALWEQARKDEIVRETEEKLEEAQKAWVQSVARRRANGDGG